jgi:two-component system, NtrC family, sensor kinase
MEESDQPGAVERLTDLSHLSAAISHHVINAFGAIVSNAELMRLDPPPAAADVERCAETIIRTALDASTVARRLIDFTRPLTSTEPDRAVFETGTLALDRLAAEVLAVEMAGGRPGIQWVAQLDPTPALHGHPDQLRAMLARLIDNAYEAMPEAGGTIHLSSATDARGWVVLELRDTGQGMDSATRQRALEPFFSTKPGHLGVGLSIANAIWRRHHGTFAIQSEPGAGTLVRLSVEAARTR